MSRAFPMLLGLTVAFCGEANLDSRSVVQSRCGTRGGHCGYFLGDGGSPCAAAVAAQESATSDVGLKEAACIESAAVTLSVRSG